MRILMVTQWFQPEPHFKGLPLARALAERGHDVQVLTGFPNYPGGRLYPGYRVRPWQRERVEGIDVCRVPLYPSHDRSSVGRIANYVSFGAATAWLGPLLVRPPDAVYVYNLVTLAPAAELFRFLHGAAIVQDVQDLWPDSVLKSGMLNVPFVSSFLSAACDRAYRVADRTIVLSPGFKRRLVDRGVREDTVEVLYNWTDESVPRTAHDPALARQWGLEHTFNVMFAGTMGAVQALGTVLDAAARCQESLPDVRFVLIGGGIDVERLAAKARTAGLENVVFVPRQPAREMARWFGLAQVALVHLRADPLFAITIPSKTQAYMAAGVPVLMAMNGDAADLIRAAEAGVACRPEAPDELVGAIRTLIAMGDERRRAMGANGAAYYRAHLSFTAGVNGVERNVVEAWAATQRRRTRK